MVYLITVDPSGSPKDQILIFLGAWLRVLVTKRCSFPECLTQMPGEMIQFDYP